MKNAWLILMLLVLSEVSFAQSYHTGSKKAIRQFEEAVDLYQVMDNDGAEQALLKAIQADDEFIDAYQLLSQICYDSGRLDEAISYFSRSLEIDPEGDPTGYRLLAGIIMRTGDYQRALETVERFLSFPENQVSNRAAGLALKENCEFAIRALENPVPFHPENLGDSVNSEHNEYWPSLSVDEQILMFTVMVPVNPGNEPSPLNVQEDFYISKRAENNWGQRQNAGPPLNTRNNEGAHAITADGRMLYFTACNRWDGKGKCDIYLSMWDDGKWSSPENLDSPVNSRFSEKHPTISADGRMLLFSSNRPGGKGSYDIWISYRSGNSWSTPVNLGDSINTAGLEQSPFLHPDQKSLYFSSTGWPGMGQGDLFLSRLSADRTWSKPVNLGYPINTYNDEIGLSVNARGNRAYFASDRGTGRDTDIYTFELPDRVRPVLVSYLTGRVYDSRNMKGLDAVIQLIDLQTEEVVMESPSTPGEGDYLVPLPTDRDYALNVSAQGYLFHSEHFSFTGAHSRKKPFRRDIPMERIVVGSSVVLKNIFFESDSHQLLPASVAELNRVVDFLWNNASLAVEIGGHTDSTGTDLYNQELSEKRATEVVGYLKAKGIAANRLVSAGYGDREPLGGNDTDEGRAINRRTELKIIQINQ